MKPEELKPFVDFMKAHGLLILTAEKPDFKICLAKEGAENLLSAVQAAGRSAGLTEQPQEPGPQETTPKNVTPVTSPLVGTFYRASVPGAAPFVEVGQEVKVGDTLCIVEAMKVMNEVKSEVSGKVLEVKAENGKPVEFGQVLFLIKSA